MLKQLLITLSIVSLVSLFAVAQEKSETEKKDKKECSHSCCGTKENKSEVNLKTNEDTAVVQIWNKVCPVEGGKIKSDSPSFEFSGKLIGLCCEECNVKFRRNPETYLKNLNENGSKFIKS